MFQEQPGSRWQERSGQEEEEGQGAEHVGPHGSWHRVWPLLLKEKPFFLAQVPPGDHPGMRI